MPRLKKVEGVQNVYFSGDTKKYYIRVYDRKFGEMYKSTKTGDLQEARRLVPLLTDQVLIRARKKMRKDDYGYLYLVLVDPTLSTQRVKLGFARDLRIRMGNYRCLSPRAQLLGKWGIYRRFERQIIRECTKGFVAYSNEVFDVPCYVALMDKIPGVIAMLGAQSPEPKLSELISNKISGSEKMGATCLNHTTSNCGAQAF